MSTTSDLRTNLIIRWNGPLHRVTEFHHHAPGNWRDIVRVDKRNMQYLYREGDNFVFMDNETFEQIELTEDTIGDGAKFLKDGMECEILFYDENKILGVEIPIFVELVVTESTTALRGDTATNVNKQVTLETGARITVPAFINEGDILRIDTRTGNYMDRVK